MAVKYLKLKGKKKPKKPSIFSQLFRSSSSNSVIKTHKHSGKIAEDDAIKAPRKTSFWVKIVWLLLIVGATALLAYFNVPVKIANLPLFSSGGQLIVATEYQPAEVFLDDSLIGVTPLNIKGLSVGDFVLKLKPQKEQADWLQELEIPIKLRSASATIVQAQLGPTKRTSSYSVVYFEDLKDTKLVVKTVLPEAMVYIDENFIGKTPLVVKHLDEGTHVLLLEKSGYKPYKLEIKIDKNRTVIVEAKLYEYVLNEN